jgi:hypothetical protein
MLMISETNRGFSVLFGVNGVMSTFKFGFNFQSNLISNRYVHMTPNNKCIVRRFNFENFANIKTKLHLFPMHQNPFVNLK